MRIRTIDGKHSKSQFIQLDANKCKACWKCMEMCENDVFGRINLPWHKHIVVSKADNCTGCIKCVKICEYGALSKTEL